MTLLEKIQDIDGVHCFTGSASTGFPISSLPQRSPEKMLALEMGGNNALIVADVTDSDAALKCDYSIRLYLRRTKRCTCARAVGQTRRRRRCAAAASG